VEEHRGRAGDTQDKTPYNPAMSRWSMSARITRALDRVPRGYWQFGLVPPLVGLGVILVFALGGKRYSWQWTVLQYVLAAIVAAALSVSIDLWRRRGRAAQGRGSVGDPGSDS
jgi:hypothetical protein